MRIHNMDQLQEYLLAVILKSPMEAYCHGDSLQQEYKKASALILFLSLISK